MSDTIRSFTTLQSLLADNVSGAISAQDVRDALISTSYGGWATYTDTLRTLVAPLDVPADTDILLPNNAGAVLDTYKPADIPSFYNGSVISGRTGDAMAYSVEFIATPTTNAATYVESWLDIGGSIGEIFRDIKLFPKGAGEPRRCVFMALSYTLDTWSTNGGLLKIRSNGPITVHSIRYSFFRLYRGSLGQPVL